VCCLFLVVDHRIFVEDFVTCLQLLPHDVRVGCKVCLQNIRKLLNLCTYATPEGTPEDSPRPGEIPLVTLPHVDVSDIPEVFTPPPQVDPTDPLAEFRIHNTIEDYRIRRGERPTRTISSFW
jgi:hypothetical protein